MSRLFPHIKLTFHPIFEKETLGHKGGSKGADKEPGGGWWGGVAEIFLEHSGGDLEQ